MPIFFFSSRRRHTRCGRDWSSDVCSSDLVVERQAVTDSLTGLANRRQFYEVLGREYERAQRFGQPVSLILLDIDDFKVINDSKGHLAGDAVLHKIGRASCRERGETQGGAG